MRVFLTENQITKSNHRKNVLFPSQLSIQEYLFSKRILHFQLTQTLNIPHKINTQINFS